MFTHWFVVSNVFKFRKVIALFSNQCKRVSLCCRVWYKGVSLCLERSFACPVTWLCMFVCLSAGLMQQLCAILMASGVPADVLTEVSFLFPPPTPTPPPFLILSTSFKKRKDYSFFSHSKTLNSLPLFSPFVLIDLVIRSLKLLISEYSDSSKLFLFEQE